MVTGWDQRGWFKASSPLTFVSCPVEEIQPQEQVLWGMMFIRSAEWDGVLAKKYKITDTKLGMNVYICLD